MVTNDPYKEMIKRWEREKEYQRFKNGTSIEEMLADGSLKFGDSLFVYQLGWLFEVKYTAYDSNGFVELTYVDRNEPPFNTHVTDRRFFLDKRLCLRVELANAIDNNMSNHYISKIMMMLNRL